MMRKDEEPIIIEQTFSVSIETVWSAITEIEQMRQWYFKNIPSFKPEVGFRIQFNVQNEERNFLHMWEVAEVIPEKKIAYRWKYDNYPGDSLVMFELFEQNNLTTLRLTHQVLESFRFCFRLCLGRGSRRLLHPLFQFDRSQHWRFG